MIPYGKHSISAEDQKAVLDVVKSDWLTQGPIVPKFEQAIAEKCDAKFGVAVNSATSALYLACKALGLKIGDELWTTAITYMASANVALQCGALVDFVDIDPITYNMCVENLEKKLKAAKKKPKIVMPVSFTGKSCNMEKIRDLSFEYGFSVIEDASHAIGGNYLGHPIGSNKFSDITIFSFHPVKIITTGEGGIALTNDQHLFEAMILNRSHGVKKRNQYEAFSIDDEIWNYEQIDLGFNFRMTDIQAALGISQLKNLDEFVSTRREKARYYNDQFSSTNLQLPVEYEGEFSSFHLYVIRLPENVFKISRNTLYQKLVEKNIGVNFHYIPVYRHPYYTKLGFEKGHCLEAEQYFKEALTLPLFPDLQPNEQTYIINEIKSILY